MKGTLIRIKLVIKQRKRPEQIGHVKIYETDSKIIVIHRAQASYRRFFFYIQIFPYKIV